jgi:hypothetical protein
MYSLTSLKCDLITGSYYGIEIAILGVNFWWPYSDVLLAEAAVLSCCLYLLLM